jgi:hypothetical protein
VDSIRTSEHEKPDALERLELARERIDGAIADRRTPSTPRRRSSPQSRASRIAAD